MNQQLFFMLASNVCLVQLRNHPMKLLLLLETLLPLLIAVVAGAR